MRATKRRNKMKNQTKLNSEVFDTFDSVEELENHISKYYDDGNSNGTLVMMITINTMNKILAQ